MKKVLQYKKVKAKRDREGGWVVIFASIRVDVARHENGLLSVWNTM